MGLESRNFPNWSWRDENQHNPKVRGDIDGSIFSFQINPIKSNLCLENNFFFSPFKKLGWRKKKKKKRSVVPTTAADSILSRQWFNESSSSLWMPFLYLCKWLHLILITFLLCLQAIPFLTDKKKKKVGLLDLELISIKGRTWIPGFWIKVQCSLCFLYLHHGYLFKL